MDENNKVSLDVSGVFQMLGDNLKQMQDGGISEIPSNIDFQGGVQDLNEGYYLPNFSSKKDSR